MKKLKLKLDEKKQRLSPALKKVAPLPSVVVSEKQLEKSDLAKAEEIARVLDVESRKELHALLTAYPALANDPEVRALEAAIQDDINNRVTPGLHTLNTRVQQQRARIVELRHKLKLVEQEAEVRAEGGAPPLPGKLPEHPLHVGGGHESEYAVLAKEAHRATKRRGGRGFGKIAGETTDPHDDTTDTASEDTSDEAPSDTHNDGQSMTGFH